MYSALVSPHGFKNDVHFIVARFFRRMAYRRTYISCMAFVSPHGLKNNECYICSALVSSHASKDDVYFIVRRLFRFMA